MSKTMPELKIGDEVIIDDPQCDFFNFEGRVEEIHEYYGYLVNFVERERKVWFLREEICLAW